MGVQRVCEAAVQSIDDSPGRAKAEEFEEDPDHEWSAQLPLFAHCHGGHYLNGDFGTAPSEICGYCGVVLEDDQFKVVLKCDKQNNAKISGFSRPCFDSNQNYKSPISSSRKESYTNEPVLCQEDPCKGLLIVLFRYNIATHIRSAHDHLDVTELISTAMA
jgi:hypothetical protein